MSNKITAAGLAADVARTSFALPEVDWNEHPCSHHGHHGKVCPSAAKHEVQQPRTGRATWGPRQAVVYAPRWTSDHHPWLVKGMDHAAGIRYASYEVEED